LDEDSQLTEPSAAARWPLSAIVLAASVTALLVVQNLRQAQMRAVPSLYHTPLTEDATWHGDWEFSEAGADPSSAGTERVTIRFAGTDFALRVRRGDYRGHFLVEIDGRPANRLPQSPQGAYLILTSPDYSTRVETIPVASGLRDVTHIAEITVDRAWDQWPLVGWEARTNPTLHGLEMVTGMLVAVGLASSCAVAVETRGWFRRSSIAGFHRTCQRVTGGIARSLLLAYSLVARRAKSLRLAQELQQRGWLSGLLATAALTGFHFARHPAISLTAGAVLAAIVLLMPEIGVGLVAAAAPFYLLPRPLLGKTFSLAELLTLLSLVSCLLECAGQTCTDRHRRWRLTPVDRAVLLFGLVAAASFLVAEFRHVGLRELRVLLLEPMLLYAMLRIGRFSKDMIWQVVDFLVVGGLLVAIIGLVQYATGVNVITAEEGFRRLRSVYGSPNSVGLYLGRILPVEVAVALLAKHTRRRVAYAGAGLLTAAAIVLSFSRGALILGVPASLLAVTLLAGGKWLRVSLGAALGAAVAAIPLSMTPRFAHLLNANSGTTFFRLQLWLSSWRMFRESPVLGVGPDSFLYLYRSRFILPAAWQEPNISQAHNILLDYVTRMGMLGLAAGAFLQVGFWKTALPLKKSSDPNLRALSIGLMASMVDFLAHGLVDASYFLVDLAFAFFLTLGIVQWLALREETGYVSAR
jgi:O-antigen ligase